MVLVQLEARASYEIREQNRIAWLAWHVASLQRAKRLPSLRKMMVRERHRKPQSPEEMLRIAKLWTQVLGGTVTKAT